MKRFKKIVSVAIATVCAWSCGISASASSEGDKETYYFDTGDISLEITVDSGVEVTCETEQYIPIERGASKPTKFYDLSKVSYYSGSGYWDVSPLFSAYYFKSNSSQLMYMKGRVYSSATFNTPLEVILIDMDSNTSTKFKVSSTLSDCSSYSWNLKYSNLNKSHKYCFKFTNPSSNGKQRLNLNEFKVSHYSQYLKI